MPNCIIDTSYKPERNKSVGFLVVVLLLLFFGFFFPFDDWAVHCLDGSSLRVDCN